MRTKVFIDGEGGTTGLSIRTRLQKRQDIELIVLDPARRKLPQARGEAFAAADLAILCLPDAAAIEAVQLARQAGHTRLIDASSAHRTDQGWVYGMPELPGARTAIAGARQVANPGCYATGAIALVRPLRDAELLKSEHRAILTGVSGYTGGGKALIAQYEPTPTAPAYFLYATGQTHKHIPEIMRHARLHRQPSFQPAVGNFAQGMVVQLHLDAETLPEGTTLERIEEALRTFYAGARFIEVRNPPGRIAATACNATNQMHVCAHANPQAGLFTLTAVLDNLGKGAGGAAVENLNLMIGAPEETGLVN